MPLRTLLLALWTLSAVFAQTVLVPGRLVDASIGPPAVHQYTIHLDAGQFVYFRVEQRIADLSLTLRGPDGKELASVDRRQAPAVEDLPWIAVGAGEYSLGIGVEPSSKPGGYQLDSVVRQPAPEDRRRFAAFQMAWVAMRPLLENPNASSTAKAIAQYEESLVVWKELGDRRWEGFVHDELAQLQDRLSRTAAARDSLLKALELQRDDPTEVDGLSTTLNGLGAIHTTLGEPQKAVSYLNEALALRRAMGYRRGEAAVLNNLGLAYSRQGKSDEALDYYTQSLPIRREIGDRQGEATSLSNLGIIYQARGDFQKSLQLYSEALRIRRELRDRYPEAMSLSGMGQVHYMLGEVKKAQEYWRQSAAISDAVGELNGLATVLGFLGQASESLGDHEGALGYFQRSLDMRRKSGNQLGQAIALHTMCSPLVALSKLDDARQAAEDSLVIGRKIQNRNAVGGALICLGSVSAKRGDAEAAGKYYSEAVQVFREINHVGFLADTLASLAGVEKDRGNLAAALTLIEEAASVSETARRNIRSPNLRATFKAASAGKLELHAAILMQMHAADPGAGLDLRAFELTERSRARSLAEMLSESRTENSPALTGEQKSREAALIQRVSSIQRDLFQPNVAAGRKAELNRQLGQAEKDVELFDLGLQGERNRYSPAVYADVWDVARIQRELLRPGTALVEYALGKEQSYGWAVTSEGLTTVVLPGRKAIEERIDAYRKELSQRATALTVGPAMARADVLGKQIYQMLVAPLERALAGCTSLVVVPDGALAYLPFETLSSGETKMIERFAISYTPSASTLGALRGRQRTAAPKMLLAFADPVYGAGVGAPDAARGFDFVRLPATRTEVTGIQAIFQPGTTRAFLGAMATEQALKAAPLESFRYLHFAAHGYLDEEQPGRSGIVLSLNAGGGEDGVLQAPEIMRLRLNADMVTLSACQSGLGRVLAGEGVLGLSRAFLYAGAQSLVVSLWNVNDAATAELMKGFYRGLHRGLAREEALRQTKLALMKGTSRAWRHPYYWAPFVFIGDGGVRVE